MPILLVKVIPNSHKNCFDGLHAGRLRVRIQAPADKGKANEMLIAFLAEAFAIPKSHIRVVSGHASRLKKLEIDADVDLSQFL